MTDRMVQRFVALLVLNAVLVAYLWGASVWGLW